MTENEYREKIQVRNAQIEKMLNTPTGKEFLDLLESMFVDHGMAQGVVAGKITGLGLAVAAGRSEVVTYIRQLAQRKEG